MADGDEQRSEIRTEQESPAMLTILQSGLHPHLSCQVLNASPGGMCLQCPSKMDPGTLIQVRLKEAIFMAEVRYCIPAAQNYRIGLEITDVMPRLTG
jgi:hypothetical protein